MLLWLFHLAGVTPANFNISVFGLYKFQSYSTEHLQRKFEIQCKCYIWIYVNKEGTTDFETDTEI